MYLNDWSESKEVGMCGDFQIEESVLDGLNILLATYTYEDCNGDAFVLFEKDGVLFEVNGCHCSCYDLEGQWEPEETTSEALLARPWYSYDDSFKSILERVLSERVTK
jgi:hypothetical protein